MLLIKMSNNAGIYVTLDEGYGVSNRGQRNNPADHMQEGFKKPIRENWMGAPTRSNFTGCGSAGYNQGKAPCASCASGHDSKRICNACRNNANSSAICGGNACAWQPPTNQYPRDSDSRDSDSRDSTCPGALPTPSIFYF